jgi:hypothetical protein
VLLSWGLRKGDVYGDAQEFVRNLQNLDEPLPVEERINCFTHVRVELLSISTNKTVADKMTASSLPSASARSWPERT